MTLDDLDTEILKVLENDARISYRSISKKLEISVGTVHNRIAKLKEQGIIKGYLLHLNDQKLNYTLKVVISLNIKGTKLRDILSKLSEYPQVTNVYSISGSVSAVLMCRFQHMNDFRDFTNLLNEEESIRQMDTNIVLDVYKEDLHHLLSNFKPLDKK
ncbi:MAG: Lrp/AsnC family transcriptional regulator [Promethearchaeota archaeon]